MKKILVLAAVIALVSTTAFAANTANLNVTATVNNACAITGGALDFGLLDPITGSLVTAVSTGVTVNCTNGAPAAVVTSDASTNPLTNGASTIPFSLALPAVTGTGVVQPYDITGTIAAGSYATALTGSYTSTVLLTVNP